jgi:C4-dicarboxylate-specific signal transduction histidine kinase
MPESAAKYYRKFLRTRPDTPERAQLERELAALELDPTEVLEPPRTPGGPGELVSPAGSALWPMATAIPFLSVLVLVWVGRRRAGRRMDLRAVIERHPELHPTIAYLIGSLRHELLKHRVAAVADALGVADTPAEGPAARAPSETEQAFVRARLTGVDSAFREHAASFVRELGHRLTAPREPLLERGARAARALERALPELAQPRGLARVRAAHAELLALDRELAELQQRLVRTRIDEALLRELVRRAYTEVDLRSAAIDDLECRAEGLPVLVEVSRSDLLLVMRNLLRNAVFAAARGGPPRLVRLVVTVELEPTGQEFVCLAVQDSSEEPLTPARIAESGLGSGLGLSAAAVRRYGGSLAVAPADPPLRKQVCVRFARLFGETTIEDR